jgi:hypothetical protein
MLVIRRESRLYKVKGFAPSSAIPQNMISSELLKLVSFYFLQAEGTLFLGIRAMEFDFITIESKWRLLFG